MSDDFINKIQKELEQGQTEVPTMKEKIQRFPVMEIFGPTIQGEGSSAGMQTYFIRMGGCDYRCTMCDSLHAVLPELIKQGATYMTAHEIFESMSRRPRLTDAVTISGGNPLMWDLTDLVTSLYANDWKVYVETQGTIFRDWLQYCDVTVSPKGPGMGEKFEQDKFIKFITECDKHGIVPTIKVVVFNAQDVELMADILSHFPHLSNKAYFSIGNTLPPQPGQEEVLSMDAFRIQLIERYKLLAEEILNDPRPVVRNVRILPQIHTLLWGNEKGK